MSYKKENFIEKSIISYIHIIKIKYGFTSNEELVKSVTEHLKKINKLIFFAVKFYFIYINFILLVFFGKYFFKLDPEKAINILKKFNYLFIINKKIEELFHAILCIHYFNNEKIKKNYLQNSNIYDAQNKNKKFEFIVVGSGPGGSITAAEIMKHSDSTLLVDKGNYFELPKTKHPGDEFLKKWSSGGINTTIYNTQINFASGNCLGGGSEINSGLYHYPDKEFLIKWKKKYNTNEISFNDLEKYILETKKFSGVNQLNLISSKQERYFLDGAKKLNLKIENIPRLISLNNENQFKKNSMSRTYLKSYLDNNGKVLLNTEIIKISYKNYEWLIDCLDNIKQKKFQIKSKFLFLCCGSIYTNKILIKSNLKKINSKSTLKNFKFHPMIKVIAEYDQKIQDGNNEVHSFQVTEFYPKSIIGNAASSIQFLLTNFTQQMKIYNHIKRNWKNMSIFHSTTSLGAGNIKYDGIISKDFLATYAFKNEEKKILIEAFEKLLDFVFSTGAIKIIPIMDDAPILLKNNYKNIIKKKTFLKKIKMSSVHILGGVTMGEDNNCVADSFGKVKNYQNLFVNDSSLINTSLLRNPQGTVMAIALRNIRNFFAKYK